MKMNRRNALIGLGAMATGGGALFGSGAFSSVEADRTVSVTTAGDNSAFLSISVGGDYAIDNSGADDAVTIDLEGASGSSGFNDDAETTVDAVLTLENNTEDGTSTDVGFSDGGTITDGITLVVDETSGTVESEVNFSLDQASNANSHTLSDGGTVDVNAAIRTGSETTQSATGTDRSSADLTILAQ